MSNCQFTDKLLNLKRSCYKRTLELRGALFPEFKILKQLLFYAGTPLKAASNTSRSLIINYQAPLNTLLASLCDKYGSDKGELSPDNNPYPWHSHTYTDYYTLLFYKHRESIQNVFECGIGTNNPALKSNSAARNPGASLRVWRDFFPNAEVVGVDIDKNILFEEERIKTYWIDQTSPEIIREFWDKLNCNPFDIMIDDGLHTFNAGKCLFENSIDRLADDGIYVIEDIDYSDLIMYQDYFKEKTEYYTESVMLFETGSKNSDNNILTIRKIKR